MPNIQEFQTGNLAIRPSETGVEARAMTARRIGTFSNQLGGAEEMLARETDRLANQTQRLGSETQQVGSQQQRLGSEFEQQGDYQGQLEKDTGRRLGSAVTDVGDAGVKMIDHAQLAQGAQKWAKLVDDHTQQWNAIVSDPKFDANDPTIVPKFMATLENDLQSFKDGFLTENGQKYAEAHVDALRLHMAEKAHADMATGAAMAIENNVRGTVNSLSNTVHGDPSSLKFALAGLDSSIEGLVSSSPTLKGVEAVKLREGLRQKAAESIVKSAAVGYIEKTAQVPPWATDPQFSKYINGAEMKMLEKQAQVQQRSDRQAAKQELITNKLIADNRAHVEANKLFSDGVSADQDGKLVLAPNFSNRVLDFMRSNPDAPSTRTIGESLLNWQQREQSREAGPSATASHAATRQAIVDMRDGTITDTNPIYKMLGDGQINKADFNFLTKEIRDRKSDQGAPLARDRDEFFKRYGASVDGAMDFGGHSALGSQRMYSFEMEARRLEQGLIAKNQDPHQLYDPQSPNFIGKLVPKYHVSLQDSMAYEKTIQKPPPQSGNLSDAPIMGVQVTDAPVKPRVPPPALREVGKVYDTPNGKGKWNGRAWETP